MVSQNKGYREPTCFLEVERRRRQFEERALLVPEVEEEKNPKVIGISVQKIEAEDSSKETVGMMAASHNQEADWLCLEELL